MSVTPVLAPTRSLAERPRAAPPPALEPGEWSVPMYLGVVAAISAFALVVVGVAYLAGATQAALVPVGAVAGALILWKPEIGVYLLVLVVPFEVFGRLGATFTLSKFIGLYTFCVFLLHVVVRRFNLTEPVFLLALAFALWSLASGIIGGENLRLMISRTLTRFQLAGLLFLVVTACRSRSRATTFFIVLFVASVLAAAAAFFLSPTVGRWTVQRATIVGRNINSHAKDLLPGVFLLPFLFKRSGWVLRTVLLVGLLLVLVGVVRTGSRSIYIAVYAGLVVMALTYRPLGMTKRVGLAVGITTLLAFFVVVGTVTGLWTPRLFERVADMMAHGLEEGGRLYLWRLGAEMGIDNPFTGVGVGNFAPELIFRVGVMGAAHNDVVLHFAETGALGLLLFLAFLGAVAWRAWRIDPPWLRAGLLGLVTAAFVASLANPSSDILKNWWLQMAAATLAGIVFARSVKSRGPSTAVSVTGPRRRGPRLGAGAYGTPPPGSVALPHP